MLTIKAYCFDIEYETLEDTSDVPKVIEIELERDEDLTDEENVIENGANAILNKTGWIVTRFSWRW